MRVAERYECHRPDDLLVVDGDVTMMSVENGKYYSLSGTSARGSGRCWNGRCPPNRFAIS